MNKGKIINLTGNAARGFMLAMYQEKIDKLEAENIELKARAEKAEAERFWLAERIAAKYSHEKAEQYFPQYWLNRAAQEVAKRGETTK